MTIKFRKYFVASPAGERTSVYYCTGLERDGKHLYNELARPGDRIFVEVCANTYVGHLGFLPNCVNNSDSQTDYFEKDRAFIYSDDPLYADALTAAMQNGRIPCGTVPKDNPAFNAEERGQLIGMYAGVNQLLAEDTPIVAKDPPALTAADIIIAPVASLHENLLIPNEPIGYPVILPETPVQIFYGRVVIDAVFKEYYDPEAGEEDPLCRVFANGFDEFILRSRVYTVFERERLLQDITAAIETLHYLYSIYGETSHD